MPELYSFDVFDTCITRAFARPQDLFLALSRSVLGESAPDSDVRGLAAERSRAESSARRDASREEIRLQDIYRELARSRDAAFRAEEMMQAEVALELANIHPIESIRARYRQLQAEGARVVFISDMYLPAATILSMLSACGYEVVPAQLYLSSDVGLKKRTGALFRHVLDREQVSAGQLEHYGDHPVSDIRVARGLGIAVVPVQKTRMSLRYESILLHRDGWVAGLQDRLQSVSKLYRRFHHDPGSSLPPRQVLALSKVTAAASLLLRNRIAADDGDDTLWAIGYFVAAPLFVSYVYWVLEKAREQRIDRLYFVARNGQIFQRIAQRICERQSVGVECRYLYGSRAAWYPASFKAYDDHCIDLVIEKYPGRSLREVFADLSFPPEEVDTLADALVALGHDPDKGRQGQTMRAPLEALRDGECSSLINNRLESAWSTLVAYLEQEHVFQPGSFGIVDIGWHLSSHNALQRILERANGVGFTGFYFGISRSRQAVSAQTPYRAWHHDERSTRNSWLFKLGAMCILEEAFANADHPTTRSYARQSDRVVPVFGEDTARPVTRTAGILQSAMLEFTDFLLAAGPLEDLDLVREESLRQFERLYKYPRREEAKALAATPVHALTSHSSSQQRILSHSISASQLAETVYRALFSGRNISPRWVWFQGSLAISNSFVAAVGRLLSFLESMFRRIKP